MNYVLDASALLAALLREPGGDLVETALGASLISAVNLAEVAASLRSGSNTDNMVRTIIDHIAIPVVPADANLAIDAGFMRQLTDRAGLSLGDRFCLALGRRTGLTVLTADRAWADVAQELGVIVEIIR